MVDALYVVIDHRTSCWQGAEFGQRVFVTLAGWRSAEPAGLTAAASHHCVSLLLTTSWQLMNLMPTALVSYQPIELCQTSKGSYGSQNGPQAL